MASQRWLLSVLTLALIGSSGVMFFQANRTKVLSTICEAGVGNLSKPAEIPSDAIDCVIVGGRETVTGVIHDSDHGSSTTLSTDAQPINLWIGKVFPSLAKQVAQSDAKYCIRGATAHSPAGEHNLPGDSGRWVCLMSKYLCIQSMPSRRFQQTRSLKLDQILLGVTAFEGWNDSFPPRCAVPMAPSRPDHL